MEYENLPGLYSFLVSFICEAVSFLVPIRRGLNCIYRRIYKAVPLHAMEALGGEEV
jgi:hypothetical protein